MIEGTWSVGNVMEISYVDGADDSGSTASIFGIIAGAS